MKIYIDDIRNPPDDSWIVFREVTPALEFIKENIGQITEISFDHDMGDQWVTRPIANWIEEEAYNSGSRFDLVTRVHSANPVGAAYLKACLSRCTNFQG